MKSISENQNQIDAVVGQMRNFQGQNTTGKTSSIGAKDGETHCKIRTITSVFEKFKNIIVTKPKMGESEKVPPELARPASTTFESLRIFKNRKAYFPGNERTGVEITTCWEFWTKCQLVRG